MPWRGTLVVSGDTDADELINTNPLALLIGMLLDQQVPLEWAFAAPQRLAQRLGGNLEATQIAELNPQFLEAAAVEKPAIHRFPAMMARRIHKMCEYLVDEYGGDPAAVWIAETDAAVVYERLLALPGFGPNKAQIFLTILVKRFDQQLPGWESIVGEYATEDLRSVADLGDPDALRRLREKRRNQKR
ncbi:MAG: Fe-S cluster assembly protein HesB [Acidimicrobiia bacterium]|nr:Fe-S cluster assembly protein HesB [Acidimicrobiia bacterium]